QLQPGGELQSVNGYPVLDAGNSPIAVDPLGGPVTIAQDGMITQGGRQIGAIGLFSLDKTAKLKRFENSSVTSDKPAVPVFDFSTNGITQGYVEGANVNPMLEMAKLIIVSRTVGRCRPRASCPSGSPNGRKCRPADHSFPIPECAG